VKADSSAEVVIQIDGGISPLRIKTNAALKHLSATYRQEIRTVTSIIEIEDKSCALSARDDDLATMKIYTLNAAASKE